MNYNERIKQTGLKKKWIAEQIGISNISLSHYINGTRNFPDDVKKKLNDIINAHNITQFNNGEAKIG